MKINQLKERLIEFNINLEQWCHSQGKKTIEDLKSEIENGETTLEIINNQLFRIVKVTSIQVQVKLGNQLFNLVEDQQIFFTGAVRKRGFQNLAEKIKSYENPDVAVYRTLEEEINLKIDKKPLFLGKTEEIKTSLSYPGLNSIYKVFNYSILLNQEELAKIQFFEYQKDKGKISLFTLVPHLN